jgi:hypothetical protein
MSFKSRNLKAIAELIIGDIQENHFPYRSSSYITEFFEECDLDFVHDGSTRKYWVADRLQELLDEPSDTANTLPSQFLNVLRVLMHKSDAHLDDLDRSKALSELNKPLSREGFEAFYGADDLLYVRHNATKKISTYSSTPHRPFTLKEQEKYLQLTEYLSSCSEDQLIEEVLLPLFRQLGYQRITAAGHKDKSLEYGKDIWMRYVLPTQHVLYFGIQVKKGKLDSAGVTKTSNANVAEIYNQLLMMLGHEIFDPETSKRVLVDHAFIIAGGEITKQARNWLGNKLDASKRSQILFMDRDDILNLYVVSSLNVPIKDNGTEAIIISDELPF